MTGALFRFVLIGAALMSTFLFPYPFTLVLSFLASIFVPWLALMIGFMNDVLFMVPADDRIPTATILGALASLVALLVRRFIKARIITQ
jgi:hypothetical protein